MYNNTVRYPIVKELIKELFMTNMSDSDDPQFPDPEAVQYEVSYEYSGYSGNMSDSDDPQFPVYYDK